MVFAAVAQVLLAFAPLAEAGSGSIAHVEEAGTAIHHTHNEASCSACVARVLLDSTEIAGRRTLYLATETVASRHAALRSVTSATPGANFSRAPPLNRV